MKCKPGLKHLDNLFSNKQKGSASSPSLLFKTRVLKEGLVVLYNKEAKGISQVIILEIGSEGFNTEIHRFKYKNTATSVINLNISGCSLAQRY